MYDKRHEINGSTIPKSTISKADNIQSELITFVFKDIKSRQLELNTNDCCHGLNNCATPKSITSKTDNSLSKEKEYVINEVICRQLDFNTSNERSID